MLPRSIFFHVPKTGGTWVREAVARAGIPSEELRHTDRGAANHHNNYRHIDTRGKFLFAFVRHPWDWYVSFWSYRMWSGWVRDTALDPLLSVDFEVFMRRVLRFRPGFLLRRYRNYTGKPPGVLDFLGRSERLADDLVRALRLAGERFDEEALRSTPRTNVAPLRPVYSPALRESVLRSERQTLEEFGYG